MLNENNFVDAFSRFGIVVGAKYHSNFLDYDISAAHGTKSCREPISVTAEMKFYSLETFNQFADELVQRDEEQRLRKKSTTLQKAWEEYQLLLKLSK